MDKYEVYLRVRRTMKKIESQRAFDILRESVILLLEFRLNHFSGRT